MAAFALITSDIGIIDAKIQCLTFLVTYFDYISDNQNIFTMSHEDRIREARLRLIAENDRRITKLQANLKDIMYNLEVLRTQFNLLVSYEDGERNGHSGENVVKDKVT